MILQRGFIESCAKKRKKAAQDNLLLLEKSWNKDHKSQLFMAAIDYSPGELRYFVE